MAQQLLYPARWCWKNDRLVWHEAGAGKNNATSVATRSEHIRDTSDRKTFIDINRAIDHWSIKVTRDITHIRTQAASPGLAERPRDRAAVRPPSTNFAQAMQKARPSPAAQVTVGNGNTLTGIVRAQAESRGLKLSGPDEHRLAQQLANANKISNADLIHVGQLIDLTPINQELEALKSNTARASVPATTAKTLAETSSVAALNSRKITAAPLAAVAPKTSTPVNHPVLEKTLDRAVAKGFIPASDKVPVYEKILQMAQEHRFAPDDFARMTLMESDGMNPRASNQRCHGIIQFCDGPARGAASAGYADNPKAILDLSVHKQLSLVDKYFGDVGLKNQGPAGLEDLYLSVLNPASRSERQVTAALDIGGKQARVLYTGSDTDAPITRQSIRQGLLQNAAARLGQFLPTAMRVPAPRTNQVASNEQH